MTMAKSLLLFAAISALVAVALGAFGAHGLKGRLTPDLFAVYETAVQYHFYHSLGLLFVGILLLQFPHAASLSASGVLMVVGIVIFSGSLYVLAISGIRWLGEVGS